MTLKQILKPIRQDCHGGIIHEPNALVAALMVKNSCWEGTLGNSRRTLSMEQIKSIALEVYRAKGGTDEAGLLRLLSICG